MRCCCYGQIFKKLLGVRQQARKLRMPKSVRTVVFLRRNGAPVLTATTKYRRDAPKLVRGERTYDIILVQQNEERFFITFPDGEVAFLEYEIRDGVFVVLRTMVPRKHRKMNIGKMLAKTALRHAGKLNLRLKIKCDYVKNYIRKHEPEYAEFLED